MIANVKPTKPYVPPYSDTFVMKVVYMLGDADSYVTREVALTEDQVIAFKNLYDHGKWTRDRGYEWGELYEALEKTFEHEEEIELHELFAADHDAWGYGKFSSLEVLWYDALGVPYYVEFS